MICATCRDYHSGDDCPRCDLGWLKTQVCNYYGHLWVREHEGGFEWSLENYDGHHWEPIPEYLYEAIAKWSAEGSFDVVHEDDRDSWSVRCGGVHLWRTDSVASAERVCKIVTEMSARGEDYHDWLVRRCPS